MFKALLILLSSIFVAPVAVNAANTFKREENPSVETQKALKDISQYTYTEIDSPDGSGMMRIFDTKELTPDISRVFAAPSGYAFLSSISDEQVDTILELWDDVNCDYKLVDLIFRYEYKGSVVYRDSVPLFLDGNKEYDERREEARQRVKDTINGHVIFKVSNIEEVTTFTPVFDFECYTNTSDVYTLRFYHDPITVEPFDSTDFFMIRTSIYEHNFKEDTETRLMVSAELIDGFFCEEPLYNVHGFHTDETTPYFDDHFFAVYSLELIAYDTVVMASFDGGGIEMSYPDEPIPAKARLQFVSKGVSYTYYSKPFTIGDPNISVYVDGYANRSYIQKGSEHRFSLHVDNLIKEKITDCMATVRVAPDKLNDPEYGVECLNKSDLPLEGDTSKYYYVSSEDMYYMWNEVTYEYDYYEITLLETMYFAGDPESEGVNIDDLLSCTASLPFIGTWRFKVGEVTLTAGELDIMGYGSDMQTINVIMSNPEDADVTYEVPENINLIAGFGSTEITPLVETEFEDTTCYFDYSLSKDGIADVELAADGKLTINPLTHGVFTITLGVESQYFPRMTKEISVRVIDTIYDVSKIEIPNEFHYAGKDLTAAINVRGFTKFANLNVQWVVENKKGEQLPAEQIVDNKDATITILKPDTDDYTITAYYDEIELDKLTVQVRYVDLNSFLRMNIWWIFLITIGFVVLVFFFTKITKHGKTTVEHIERVYEVFCKCYSDDKLTKDELNKIKKEITKCVHRCEDLNIDALNQYEKATRYLKKSLADTKTLIKDYDRLSAEERSVLTDRLDKDLAKALNVAKEIESAKDLIESYHMKANRSNYEKITEDKKSK